MKDALEAIQTLALEEAVEQTDVEGGGRFAARQHACERCVVRWREVKDGAGCTVVFHLGILTVDRQVFHELVLCAKAQGVDVVRVFLALVGAEIQSEFRAQEIGPAQAGSFQATQTNRVQAVVSGLVHIQSFEIKSPHFFAHPEHIAMRCS